jgi:hypothetical protein
VSDSRVPQSVVLPEGSVAVHNEILRNFITDGYTPAHLQSIETLLKDHGVFEFAAIRNGLFPGVAQTTEGATAPYRYVWVRDNVYIAYAHYLNGATETAAANFRSLAAYFLKHQSRFLDIISDKAKKANPMNRPHVRFDGARLEEVPQEWAHAQNDALGYFLWLFCRLAGEGLITLDSDQVQLVRLFVDYFAAIEFWHDEDNGHWEEARKISASSIGVVVGALRQVARVPALADGLQDRLAALLERGTSALLAILPAECIQPDPTKFRSVDAALLFVVYPMAAVDHATADRIVANVVGSLQREIGVCRYLGDSYWAADYKEHFATPGERTRDFSNDMGVRDAWLREGQEAQWCLFDPILSAIYGERYRDRRDPADFARQSFYFSRSLGQITGDFKCPEAYYLEHGRWVPNDHTPLLWTQANLWTAAREIERSLMV